MKVIFLDIDGVLNSQLFYEKTIPEKKKEFRSLAKSEAITWLEYHLSQIDPNGVDFLNAIIDSTQAQVVLSSSWRINNSVDYMQTILGTHGFKGQIIDSTPILRLDRGLEIEEWLKGKDIQGYVILDDDSDMTPHQLLHNFVWVDRYCGISPSTIWKAQRILNGESSGQFRNTPKQ